MPEYLAPGVYVEEVSYRSKSIEGVSTSTTGFVGPTRYGPVDLELEVLTNLLDFERIYGDRQALNFGTGANAVQLPNYVWHAARAYFENGGARLYVKRIFNARAGNSGRATATVGGLTATARFPGEAGGRTVTLTFAAGPNVLVPDGGKARAVGLIENDLVILTDTTDNAAVPALHSVQRTPAGVWQLQPATPPAGGGSTGGGGPVPVPVADLNPAQRTLRVVTVSVTDLPPGPDAISSVWTGLPLDPAHNRGGAADSLFSLFSAEPANRALGMRLPIVLTHTATTGLAIASDLLTNARLTALRGPSAPAPEITLVLANGNDGDLPEASDYEGETTAQDVKLGLVALEDVEDVSIVAAPGSSRGYEDNDSARLRVATIQQALISHCARMRYRIAVLDSAADQTISQVRQMRARIDSSYAAFYYPWVTVVDPVTNAEIQLPPSGFVCGIYARSAVYKAPANEVVTLAVGFERFVNKGQQDVLNPDGVNCLRYFPGRGMRLWGARTATSDPEWKYVNLRRYFAYLEHSIDRGTQWAVFEPNGERLWANVTRTIEGFLFDEWQAGALLGDRPDRAFFVRCDRTTMSQNDLDNGRLVCQIGVAPLRPAEYVIFRIGQWTADKSR